MKKLSLVILILIVALTCAFSTNYQKTYLMTDDIWIRANRLCISTGHLGPTPVSPTTGAEILNAIERLDYNSLTAAQKNEYDYIVSELTDPTKEIAFTADNIILDPNLLINTEAYGFSHLKDTPVDEFFVPYRDRLPFLNIGLNAHFGDMAYFELEYLYKDNNAPSDSNFFSFTNFSFLIAPTIDGGWTYFFKENGVTPYQPMKVGGSFGNDYMNLYIGRTRQEFGNGVTGNLVIGDNYSFQEVIQAERNASEPSDPSFRVQHPQQIQICIEHRSPYAERFSFRYQNAQPNDDCTQLEQQQRKHRLESQQWR